MQPGDLNDVLATAASSPEAPQWPRSAYVPYLTAEGADTSLLRIGLIAADPDSASHDLPGFACATFLRDGLDNDCQLDSMAVHPSHRRRGAGTALLREIFRWAHSNGAHRITLEVRASNTGAITLYRSFGLRPEGRRPRYYADPEEDALLLSTLVTSGSPSPGFPR
jgi:ribosomal-protein-alanine N-acetyltransferase